MKLEQCEKLKKWGLPQNKSRLYYRDDGKLFHCNEVGLIFADEEDQFACPDLEQLLEFAKTKIQELFGKEAALEILSGEKSGWEANAFKPSAEAYFESDPDPKQAIYKLLEKIMGEAPHNKEKS